MVVRTEGRYVVVEVLDYDIYLLCSERQFGSHFFSLNDCGPRGKYTKSLVHIFRYMFALIYMFSRRGGDANRP